MSDTPSSLPVRGGKTLDDRLDEIEALIKQVVDALTDGRVEFVRLSARIDALERRIDALERLAQERRDATKAVLLPLATDVLKWLLIGGAVVYTLAAR